MKLCLHICCAPCLTVPYFDLKQNQDIDLSGYFYNHNIHPFKEFKNRLRSLKDFADKEAIKIDYDEKYGLYDFMQIYVGGALLGDPRKKQERCKSCYKTRLTKTAEYAKKNNFDAFSTTMLLSPYQDHEMMKTICEDLADKNNIEFYYKDWRNDYKKSVEYAKEFDLYRQSYCGCIFSEYENKKNKTIL